MPLWTCWRQFRQHRRKRSDERPKLFDSMSENYLKFSNLSEKKLLFLWNCSYGNVEWSFDGTAEIFPTKGQKSLSQCAIMNIKYTFSESIVFLKLFLWTRRMQFSQLRQHFVKNAKNSLLSVPKWTKIRTFFEKLFFLKLFLWTRRLQFSEPLRKCFKTDHKFYAQCRKLMENA